MNEEVALWIGGSGKYQTTVYVSASAHAAIEKEGKEAITKKLDGWAQVGFRSMEGERDSVIRHEVGHTYRIRYKHGNLFRIIGFYEDDHKRSFVILDAFKKPGDDYTSKQWKRMEEISAVRENGTWSKME